MPFPLEMVTDTSLARIFLKERKRERCHRPLLFLRQKLSGRGDGAGSDSIRPAGQDQFDIGEPFINLFPVYIDAFISFSILYLFYCLVPDCFPDMSAGDVAP